MSPSPGYVMHALKKVSGDPRYSFLGAFHDVLVSYHATLRRRIAEAVAEAEKSRDAVTTLQARLASVEGGLCPSCKAMTSMTSSTSA
jgi:hypothetical protein